MDGFVENLAQRNASFDKKIIATIKSIISERVVIPKNEHIMETQPQFFTSLTEPEARGRIKILLDQGLQIYDDVELRDCLKIKLEKFVWSLFYKIIL